MLDSCLLVTTCEMHLNRNMNVDEYKETFSLAPSYGSHFTFLATLF
jgi:hypothetical protein